MGFRQSRTLDPSGSFEPTNRGYGVQAELARRLRSDPVLLRLGCAKLPTSLPASPRLRRTRKLRRTSQRTYFAHGLRRVARRQYGLALRNPELAKGEVWAGVDSNH
jgi:hypothetical protein